MKLHLAQSHSIRQVIMPVYFSTISRDLHIKHADLVSISVFVGFGGVFLNPRCSHT